MAAKASTRQDDIFNTLIYLVGMGGAAYFLFAFDGWTSYLFAIPLIIIAGGRLRLAWKPYGRVIEPTLILTLCIVAILFLTLWSLVTGATGNFLLVALLGFLAAWEARDLRRAMKWAKEYLDQQDQKDQASPD